MRVISVPSLIYFWFLLEPDIARISVAVANHFIFFYLTFGEMDIFAITEECRIDSAEQNIFLTPGI